MALTVALIPLLPRASEDFRRFLAIALFVADLLYASFLVYYTGGLVSQLYLFYCLLAFKAAIYYPYVHSIIFVPFLIFPLYIATLYLDTGTLVFFQDRLFATRYALLLIFIFAGMYTAWHLDSRHRRTRGLLEQLEVEHRQTDERRRELRAILDSIVDGVIVVDPELRLLMMNPVAANLLNLAYPQRPGALLSELTDHQALLNLLRQALKDSVDRDNLLGAEMTALPKSAGKPIVCQAIATALVSEHEALHGAVVVLRDMTRQKELEESKSNFISVLSHELRTPLTAIRGFLDLLLTDETMNITQKQHQYLNIVFDQSEHLESLINALLEFTELEESDTTLDLDVLSLEKPVLKVLGQLEPLADQKAIDLKVHMAPNIEPLVGDARRLERVLFNLLDNAIKFTPEHGQVVVTVSDRDSEVLFCVTDSGSGVPPAERERVFEHFYQMDSTSTRTYGGAGLGLAICRHIVGLHKGRIWVEEPEGEATGNGGPGSRFCFTVPRNLEQLLEQAPDTIPDEDHEQDCLTSPEAA